jgi:hypothetical protein
MLQYITVFSVPCRNLNHFYSIGGLRHVDAREKMLFSRTFNEVVLGFLPEKGSMCPLQLRDEITQLQYAPSVCSIYHF